MDIHLPRYNVFTLRSAGLSQIIDWGHTYLRASQVYGKTQGEGAIIFIIDTAGEFTHPDLKANALNGLSRNFTNSATTRDLHGHGTHCAGISNAVDNNEGVIGIAPRAKLVALKTLNDQGSGNFNWSGQALRYVADLELPDSLKGMKRIISMSSGGANPHQYLYESILYAINKGCFFIAAAGNDGYSGKDTVLYPGNYSETITVGSIDKKGKRSYFSAGGANVDIVAPGEKIYSTHTDNGYAYLSGTSMATPQIAGLAALLVSLYPEITHQTQLEAYLKDHAKDIGKKGFDNEHGAGVPVLDNYLINKPKRGKRFEPHDIDFILPGTYTAKWRYTNENEFKDLNFSDLRINLVTDMFTEDAYLVLRKAVDEFFTGRTISIPPSFDFKDAAYHIGVFMVLVLKRFDLDIEIHSMCADYNGISVVHSGISKREAKVKSEVSSTKLPLELINKI